MQNYQNIADVFPPLRPILSSLVVAVPKTAGLVLVSALAGYGFACHGRAPGHKFLLIMAFATLFFPPSLALIPLFLQMSWLGWLNTFWPLIIPALVPGFGVISAFAVEAQGPRAATHAHWAYAFVRLTGLIPELRTLAPHRVRRPFDRSLSDTLLSRRRGHLARDLRAVDRMGHRRQEAGTPTQHRSATASTGRMT